MSTTTIKLHCLHCGSSDTSIMRSRQHGGGYTHRLLRCRTCNATSEYMDDRPRSEMPPPANHVYRLTDRQLTELLMQRGTTHAHWARQFGCSPELIRQIRLGMIYRRRVPAVPRWSGGPVLPPPELSGPSCINCTSWDGTECRIGFPDPGIEGPGFAADCSLFSPGDANGQSL